MTMSDPIADMLTRIRNANTAKHDTVEIPASNTKKAIAEKLNLNSYSVIYDSPITDFTIFAKERAEPLLNKGIKICYIQVYNDPVTTFKNMLHRGVNEGRFLPCLYFLNGMLVQKDRPKTIEKRFKDVKEFTYIGIDNSGNNVKETLCDLKNAGVDIVTIGQYIQPSKSHLEVEKFYTPEEFEDAMIALCDEGFDPLTMASLWFSLFRTDQRKTMKKINVPFLYIMPETPLYSMEAVDCIKDNVCDGFVLENNFPGTTHAILSEMPHKVAEAVKKFMEKY